jgi:hypothetical protein
MAFFQCQTFSAALNGNMHTRQALATIQAAVVIQAMVADSSPDR